MELLTNKEVKQLNEVNTETAGMKFGDKIQQIITGVNKKSFPDGSPVNAVNASETLTVSDVVLHGETVTIYNPVFMDSDVYEFLADEAQIKADPAYIAVDITDATTKSNQLLTIDTQPTSGDTMIIGTKGYVFVPDGTANADGEISIGTDLATAQANIVAAINGTDGVNAPNSKASADIFALDSTTITALIGGVAGDSIVTTETFTAATNAFGADALAGGADCSAADAITALVAAITSSDTQGVSAADGTGDTLVITCDVAGVIGNDVVIGETMTNGAFTDDAVLLSGGVDGTVGVNGDTYKDESYLYVCIADNTIADKNWRRISLGSEY